MAGVTSKNTSLIIYLFINSVLISTKFIQKQINIEYIRPQEGNWNI